MERRELKNTLQRTSVFLLSPQGIAVVAVAVVVWALLMRSNAGYTAAILIWLLAIWYTLRRFSDRIVFFTFLVTFFVFLVGRGFLVQFIHFGDWKIPDDAWTHLSIVLGLSVGALLVAHVVVERLYVRRNNRPLKESRQRIDKREYGRSARLLYWATFPVALYQVLSDSFVNLTQGYSHLYFSAYREWAASGVNAILSQIELVYVVAFVAFLAVFPSLPQARPILFSWIGFLALTLLTGQRGQFITGLLLVLIYLVIRHSRAPMEGWISAKLLKAAAFAVPIMIVMLALVEVVRGVGNGYASNPLAIFPGLLFNQGVSATVISNGWSFQDAIPDQVYLSEFTHSGILARILEIPVIQGNSVARATEGASFTHALSYTVLGPDAYLAGRGTGSSFVAEGFADLGYFGVALVGLLYGGMLALIQRVSPKHFIAGTFGLLILQDLLWAPRGSATGFLMTLCSPSTLLGVGAITLVAFIGVDRIPGLRQIDQLLNRVRLPRRLGKTAS